MTYLRPSFFIIGANKCGTSSLYRYLLAHPKVLPCAEKEPNFFGRHSPAYIASHLSEYYALFPTREWKGDLAFEWEASDQAGTSLPTTVMVERQAGVDYITGEASANTFQDVSPSLLHQHLPDVKLILLLRNPVDRAYSHHRMYRRFQDAGSDLGFEVRDFETDIRAEMKAHAGGEKTEYLSPGIYLDKLQAWVNVYGWEQVRVVVTERMARPTQVKIIMREMEDYLDLPHHEYGDFLTRRFNRAPSPEIAPPLRELLAELYRPHNRLLEEYLGRELHWD